MLSTINLRMCHLRILLSQLQGLMMYDFIISKFLSFFFLFKLVLFALLIHIFCIRFMHLLLMLVV